MAAMSTNLTLYSNNGDSFTYRLDGHTSLSPQLILQRRRLPTGNQTVIEDEVSVVYTTEDSEGNILSSKILFSAKVRRDQRSQSSDITAALAVFRDLIAGDEFGAVVDNGDPLLTLAG
jgi:hypothetical protein